MWLPSEKESIQQGNNMNPLEENIRICKQSV